MATARHWVAKFPRRSPGRPSSCGSIVELAVAQVADSEPHGIRDSVEGGVYIEIEFRGECLGRGVVHHPVGGEPHFRVPMYFFEHTVRRPVDGPAALRRGVVRADDLPWQEREDLLSASARACGGQ
jgi:hypothetical protein